MHDLRAELEELLLDYVDAADRLDVIAVADVLADARVEVGGVTASGRSQIEAVYHAAFDSAPRARHLLSNVRVMAGHADDGSTTATLRAAYVRWPVEGGPTPLGLGDYDLEVTRIDNTWRITSFRVRRQWTA